MITFILLPAAALSGKRRIYKLFADLVIGSKPAMSRDKRTDPRASWPGINYSKVGCRDELIPIFVVKVGDMLLFTCTFNRGTHHDT